MANPRLRGAFGWRGAGRHLALCVSLGLLAGCSTGEPAGPAESVITATETPQVRLVATASVLITEKTPGLAAPIASIEISPGTVVVDPGEVVDLSARALGPDGETLSDIEFVWSSADPRAGNVSRDGSYQAGPRPGTFDQGISVTGIQNTQGGVKFASAFASITIVGEERRPELASVIIVPRSPTLFDKQIYRLRAIGFDADGVVIPGVNFVWTLNEPTLGRLNDLGLLTVKSPEGSYEEAVSVTGIWEGGRASASADIRVATAPQADDFLTVHALPQRFFLDPGDRMQLRAVALNGLGEMVAGTQLRWEIVDADVGVIDGGGNFVAGDRPGIYTEAVRVEAMVPGERGFVRAADFASVVIREVLSSRRLHTVVAIPAIVPLPAGGRVILGARAVDESGEPARNVTFTWKVVKEGVGELSDIGAFTAGSTPGVYRDALQVTAEQTIGDETVTRTRSVDVIVSGTLSRAEAFPSLATIAPGRTVHFSLSGWDENEVLLPGLVVLWSVTDEKIGSIDPFGNFTAGAEAGLYTDAIRAEVIQQHP